MATLWERIRHHRNLRKRRRHRRLRHSYPLATPTPTTESWLLIFKHLVWLTGGALGVVILVAGYLFHSNLQDSLRDVRQDAKGEATRVATEEAEKGVKAVLSGTNMNELVQRVAREGVAEAVTGQMVEEKVGPIADKMIEQRLASRLRPIEQRIMLVGRIAECGARIHMGFRPGLDELIGILNDARDSQTRQLAESTLVTTAKAYEDYMLADVQRLAPNKAFDLLKMGAVRPIQPPPSTLRDVVGLINKHEDLNVVAMAFLAFRDMTSERVRMFDFAAVKSWCAGHQPKCEQ
jgi:hypothetical protein